MSMPMDEPAAESAPGPAAPAGEVPTSVEMDAGNAFADALNQARDMAMQHSQQMAKQEGNAV